MYTVYVLKSLSTSKHYIGYTSDLEKRLKEHNQGKTKSTKDKGSYKLIYTERFKIKQEAYKRERQIKSYKGGNAFKELIKHCPVG